MRKILLHRLFMLIGAGLGLGVTILALDQDWIGFSVASPMAPPSATELAKGSPGWLIEKHDCWTGEAPADMEGVLPGHVVLTDAGNAAPTYGGNRAVGVALEQLAHDGVLPGDGRDHGVTVHGFCR